jgi:divalent metal cation (Fe/Co/Zn/Cd) transporter
LSTHAAALSIAALAYRFARLHAHSPQFSFGTGKLGELAAFARAIILAMIALFIGYESITRLYQPVKSTLWVIEPRWSASGFFHLRLTQQTLSPRPRLAQRVWRVSKSDSLS